MTHGKTRLENAVEILKRKAAELDHGEDSEAVLQSSYDEEVERINENLQNTYDNRSEFVPTLYLRGRDPIAGDVLRLLRDASKSFELNLRFREIEKLDDMHAKLWELLGENGRTCVTLEEYEEVMSTLSKWSSDTRAEPERERRSGSITLVTDQLEEPQLKGGSNLRSPVSGSSTRLSGGRSANSPERRAVSPSGTRERESLQRPADAETPLGNIMYLSNVRPPRPSIELFLASPRNVIRPEAVDISVIYQLLAKKISLVKTEAELLMWDTNNDGRLSEDEMENYVRDLVPRIAALRDMSEDVLPFYCCTASRRIFWDLDTGNHGTVRVDALLQSAVMDEWVSLQLLTDDTPQNWFGAMATTQLYEKFLLLDSRNEGTLNSDNIKRYKKGLPTVTDDGLPIDVSPLSSLFIDRYFETNTMMTNSEMDYRKFVDFVIAVEMLPQCSRPNFLWNILDMHGAGVLTPMVANCFFRETYAKLVGAGLQVPSREVVIQEVFDLIPTAEPLRITREEFVASPHAGLFAALLIDCLSFWAYENREQR